MHAELVLDVPVEHGLLLENLLDLAHAPFTHTTTFAKGWPVPGAWLAAAAAEGWQQGSSRAVGCWAARSWLLRQTADAGLVAALPPPPSLTQA